MTGSRDVEILPAESSPHDGPLARRKSEPANSVPSARDGTEPRGWTVVRTLPEARNDVVESCGWGGNSYFDRPADLERVKQLVLCRLPLNPPPTQID